MRSTLLQQARNAFELLSRQPQHGLSCKLSRTSWSDDCYWTISKVRLSPDGKHGTAWGVLTWRGQQQRPEQPTQVRGPLKPVWRLLPSSSSQPERWQSLVAGALRQEQRAAAAAAAPAHAGEAAAEAAEELEAAAGGARAAA